MLSFSIFLTTQLRIPPVMNYSYEKHIQRKMSQNRLQAGVSYVLDMLWGTVLLLPNTQEPTETKFFSILRTGRGEWNETKLF